MAPGSPGSDGADAGVDGVAHALHDGVGRCNGPCGFGGATILMAPRAKPEAPMPWK